MLRIALVGLAIILLFGLLNYWRRRRTPSTLVQVADGPQDSIYKAYTTEYDLILSAEDIPDKLRDTSPDQQQGWVDINGEGWRHTLSLSEEYRGNLANCKEAAMRSAQYFPRNRGSGSIPFLAITILVDQSGSMRGRPIAAVKSAIAIVTTMLSQMDTKVEILGFSTAGWVGGFAYQHWLHHNRPERPGRLCALLHIIYKSAEDLEWNEQSQQAMLHPDVLRENIDGEALRWARDRLEAIAARRKILLILSDGAPLDDATLLHNGPSYLERDLQRAIAEIEASGTIQLAAIGVGYDVSGHYRFSHPSALDLLPDTMLQLISELIAQPVSAPTRH